MAELYLEPARLIVAETGQSVSDCTLHQADVLLQPQHGCLANQAMNKPDGDETGAREHQFTGWMEEVTTAAPLVR